MRPPARGARAGSYVPFWAGVLLGALHPPRRHRPAGLFYLVPQLGDIIAVLQRYNVIQDLADGLDAPLDNFVNAQLFPLPQVRGWARGRGGSGGGEGTRAGRQRAVHARSLTEERTVWGTHALAPPPLLPQDDEQLRALLRRFLDDFCSTGAAASSETVRPERGLGARVGAQ